MTVLGAEALAAPSADEKLRAWLAKPLVAGASVSADWSSQSPGKKLALRYTKESKIETVAFGGCPGIEVVPKLSEAVFRDRTAVIAIDLFFWDSTLAKPEASKNTLRRFVAEVRQRRLPLVLGEVPELLPGRQPSRSALNQALEESCRAYERCVLMPFDRLHRQVLRDGYLEIRGKRHSLSQLVPDGLHLAEAAGDFLADLMEELLKKI